MQHISDDLPLLLTGDATRDVVLEAATHLRVCVDCQQELVSAVIAHASLMSAHRFAPEIVAPEIVASEIAGSGIAGSGIVTSEATTRQATSVDDDIPEALAPLPDMSALFADARTEADPLRRVNDTPGVRRGRKGLLAVAAAAVVLAGGGVTYAVLGVGGDSGPNSRTVAMAGTLGASDGKVILVDQRMHLDASKLPRLGPRQQYEVWLTTADGARKQSVGFIDEGITSADFAAPSKVMSLYNDIAVSIQGIHQTEFSGRVVLRGNYG